MNRVCHLNVLVPLVGMACVLSGAPAGAAELADEVHALFARHCCKCHGPDEEEGGLRLDVRERALKGGASGPALVEGKPAESLIYQFITGQNEDKIIMPPKGRGRRLNEAECKTVGRWIEAGAPWSKGTLPGDAIPTLDKAGIISVRGAWRRLR